MDPSVIIGRLFPAEIVMTEHHTAAFTGMNVR